MPLKVGATLDFGSKRLKLSEFDASIPKPWRESQVHAIQFPNGTHYTPSAVAIDGFPNVFLGDCVQKGFENGEIPPECIVDNVKLVLLSDGGRDDMPAYYHEARHIQDKLQRLTGMPGTLSVEFVFFRIMFWSIFWILRAAADKTGRTDVRVEELIICLPQCFTKDAAKLLVTCAKYCGVRTVRVVYEGQCVGALYLSLSSRIDRVGKRILILDCGGSTCDMVALHVKREASPTQPPDAEAYAPGQSLRIGSLTINHQMKSLLFRNQTLGAAAAQTGLSRPEFERRVEVKIEAVKVRFGTQSQALSFDVQGPDGRYIARFDAAEVDHLFRNMARRIERAIVAQFQRPYDRGQNMVDPTPDYIIMTGGAGKSLCLRRHVARMLHETKHGPFSVFGHVNRSKLELLPLDSRMSNAVSCGAALVDDSISMQELSDVLAEVEQNAPPPCGVFSMEAMEAALPKPS